VLVGAPIGGDPRYGVRPYAELGVGWLQRKLRVDNVDVYANENDLAYTIGGGIMGFVGDHVGLRGDYRYLQSFSNDDLDELLRLQIDNRHFGFSRLSFGVLLRF